MAAKFYLKNPANFGAGLLRVVAKYAIEALNYAHCAQDCVHSSKRFLKKSINRFLRILLAPILEETELLDSYAYA